MAQIRNEYPRPQFRRKDWIVPEEADIVSMDFLSEMGQMPVNI